MAATGRRSGPSAGSSRPPSSRSAGSLKKVQQQHLLDQLISTFHSDKQDAATTEAQRSKLQRDVEKQIWSPADRWEVERYIDGLSRRHAIDLSYELSAALRKTFAQLKVSAKQSVELTQTARELHLIRQRELERLHDNSGRSRRPSASAKGKATAEDGLLQDPPITPDSVADVVQLLISLSRPADVTTATYAHLLLDPERPKKTTYLDPQQKQAAERAEWNKILLEEPLEGDEWRSGSSDKSELSAWSDASHDGGGRQDAGSNSDDDEYRWAAPDAAKPARSDQVHSSPANDAEQQVWQTAREHRAWALEETSLRQYREDLQAGRLDDVPDVVIVREAILALQGCSGLIFEAATPDTLRLQTALSDAARRQNADALYSQLESIAAVSSTLLKLQAFGDRYTSASKSDEGTGVEVSKSLEALAEQISEILGRSLAFFAVYDCDLAAGLTATTSCHQLRSREATLSALLHEVERETLSLRAIAELLSDLDLLDPMGERRGADVDRAMLDGLQALLAFDLGSGGHEDTARLRQDLSHCFLAMAQPWWEQVCKHVSEGVAFTLANVEATRAHSAGTLGLFERNEAVAPHAAAFWQRGYHLRRSEDQSGLDSTVPAFLAPFAHELLDCAKSVGLLRALGSDSGSMSQPCQDLRAILGGLNAVATDAASEDGADSVELGDDSVASATFLTRDGLAREDAASILRTALFSSSRPDATSQRRLSNYDGLRTSNLHTFVPSSERGGDERQPGSSDELAPALLEPRLSKTLSRHLRPTLTLVRKRLHDVLVNSWYEGGCDLHTHLTAVQGLYLMTRGVELSEWCDLVFEKLDSTLFGDGADKLDAHFLDSSFRDIAGPSGQDARELVSAWIDTGAVRFRVDTSAASSKAGIRSLASIAVTYQVPWPTAYCLTPDTLSAYQAIFTLLLQVRRARSTVAGLLKASHRNQHLSSLRSFWGLRGRIDWLGRVLGEYLTRDVIESSAQQLRSNMDELTTFDSMIECHGRALDRICFLCFLQPDQRKLHNDILDVLDLAVDICGAYEATFCEDPARANLLQRKDRERAGRRRRTQRRRRHHRRGNGDDDTDDDDGEDAALADVEAGDAVDGGFKSTVTGTAVDRMGGGQSELSGSSLSSSTADASSGWLGATDEGRHSFRDRMGEASDRLSLLLERIKVGVDEQIGKLAVGAAADEEAARTLHDERDRFQALLYALGEGR